MALLFASGCGNDDKKSTSVASAARPAIPRGQPETPVLMMLRLTADGAVPPAVLQYDPTVRRATGIEALANTISRISAGIDIQRWRVFSKLGVAGGTLVRVEGKAVAGGTRRYSFIVTNGANGWKIVFDSLVGSYLSTYALPSGTKRDDRGLTAEQIAQTFRLASLKAAEAPEPGTKRKAPAAAKRAKSATGTTPAPATTAEP